ncbi:MAG: sugar transferase [Microthrixaceae bacterium]
MRREAARQRSSTTYVEGDGPDIDVLDDPALAEADTGPVAPTDAEVVKLPVRHADGPFAGAERRTRGSASLRHRLIAFDVCSVVVGWALASEITFTQPVKTEDTAVVGVFVLAMAVQLIVILVRGLYQSRVAARRTTELNGLAVSSAAAFAVAAIIGGLGPRPPIDNLLLGAVVSFVLLASCRTVYTSWLRAHRARGRYSRRLLLVGTNDEARSLQDLLATHTELGFTVSGIVGDHDAYQRLGFDAPYLGDVDSTLDAVGACAADGVLIASSSVDRHALNDLSRDLLQHDVHVQLSTGLWGIDHRRLRPLPLSHEPLFYLEPAKRSRIQLALKRAIDIVVSGAALTVMSPILLLAAVAIKLQDGGPVLFKQRRVGKDGKELKVFKLRTMVPDAEARLADVLRDRGNQRDSVLFKLHDDPRRTPVGRILEATSIDEFPQLFNVLLGSMSIVGPRPALPREVQCFDDDLKRRFEVTPGVTGLWQVEARDNPAFSAYKRLDLFYVENWSLLLDLIIMVETVTSVGARILRGGKSAHPTADASTEAAGQTVVESGRAPLGS